MIRKRLVLDHFYLGFNTEEINDLKKITKIFKRCNHSKVKSGKDAWEGVYLYSNIGSYFEMILDKEKYGFGIATSGQPVQYVDVTKIIEKLPNLPWTKGKRKLGETKKTWFEWISLKPFKHKSEYSPFYTWLMRYYLVDWSIKDRKIEQCSIDRFLSLKIEVGKDHIDYIKYHSQWLPGKATVNRTSVEIIIPNRDFGEFKINIKLVPGDMKPKFRSLTMQICPGKSIKLVSLKHFKFKQSSNTVILTRKL